MNYPDILQFWFEELTSADWFKKSEELDLKIKNEFEDLYFQVVAGEKEEWRNVPEGRLAEILVLDQFSRNMFRDDPKSFQADMLALALAQETIRCGDDLKIKASKRTFVYMPFMHSESKTVHIEAEKIFKNLGEMNYKFELKHKKIIDEFCRYPHRNKILGRTSTEAEVKWIEENGGF